MRRLYDFIKSIDNNSIDLINCYQNAINIEFSYFTGLENIISFEEIQKLNQLYPNVLNIYKCTTVVEEVNISDFLTDQEEYEEEIIKDNLNESKYKLIINNLELIKLIVNTNQENNILVFLNKDSLLKELDVEPQDYRKLEEKFYNSNKNIIIIIEADTLFYNNFSMIIGLNRDDVPKKIEEFINYNCSKNDICQLRNISCSWVDSTRYLNPNHTFIYKNNLEFKIDEDILKKLMEITVNLTMLSICNFTGEIEGEFKSIINSSKRIEITYKDSIDYNYDQCKNLHTIYNWIYDIPSIDKLNISRNVISALIVAKCQGNVLKTILDNSELLLNSLNDNLESYTQENVSKFFEEKSKKKKELLDDIKDITEQTEAIIKLIVSNMTSLIAVSIAGVVVYMAKSSFLIVKILGILYVLQLDISLLLSVPINSFKYSDTIKNFERIKKQYEEVYFKDNDISIYEKKMNTTKKLLVFYIIIILIIIVALNILAYNIVFKEFLKWILLKLN